MGMNFQSCCHKCKRKVFHFRDKENETLIPFYSKHYPCLKENPSNLETLEDQAQEKEWMYAYADEWVFDDKNRKYLINK